MMIELLRQWAFALIPLIAGAVIGLTIADLDLAPPIPLAHRSFWTHGPLVPAVIVWAVIALAWPWLYWFALGLLPAFALHCAYDMWPKKWVSIAKISLYPIPWRLSGSLSFSVLAASVVASLAGAAYLAPSGIGLWAVLLVVIIVGRRYVEKETRGDILALASFSIAMGGALLLINNIKVLGGF